MKEDLSANKKIKRSEEVAVCKHSDNERTLVSSKGKTKVKEYLCQ